MESAQQEAGQHDDSNSLTVGKIVQVEARTWPGINKPGGVGRITQLNYSEDGKELISVNVHYTVVGGRERHVPIEHVQAAPEFDAPDNSGTSSTQNGPPRNQLRDRSGLLGRCKRCGSLRADCGSCDWLEQERLAEQARNAPLQQEASAGSRQRSSNKFKTRKRRIPARQEESLSSSSDDEELIRADNLRRRLYQKQKAYWLAFDNSASSDTEDSEQEDESSLAYDDSLLVRIAELERSRREKKKRKLAKKYSKVSKKKTKRSRGPLQAGLSSLETLTEPPRMPTRGESSIPMDKRDEGETQSPPAIPPKPKQREVIVEDVGNADDSSEDSLPPPPPDDPMEETHFEEESQQMVDLAGDSLDLEGLGFIQPEGDAAAEHLPSDIVDRTRSVPYKQLPAFFDDLVKDLEDMIIPEAHVDIESFSLETRDARQRSDTEALQRQKEKGLKLYDDIQRKVIKDGIDQCRQAMRRMTDSHQRRSHKNEMTKEEQNQFRSVALEARDARLDLVVPQAETVLRDAISTLLGDFGSAAPESDIGDEETSDSSRQSSRLSSYDDYLTQDLISTNEFRLDEQFEDGETASLPPFDPHMHATTVRTHTASKRSSQRSTVRNKRRRKGRKQRNERMNGDRYKEDTNMADHGTDEQGARKRKRRRGASRESASGTRESDGSDVSRHSGSPGEDSLGFGSDDEPRAPRQRRRAAVSRPRSNRDLTGIATNERSTSSVPVADRMQAFLDANSSNIDDFDGFSHLSDGSQENAAGSRRHRQRRREDATQRNRPILDRASATNEDTTSLLYGDDSSPDEGDDVARFEVSTVSTDVFYDRLARRRPSNESRNESSRRPTASFSDSCQAILSTYCDSADGCATLFDSIVLHFKEQSPIVHAQAAEIFGVVLQLLQEHGARTLQAVALTEVNKFRRHARLLVFVLELIDYQVHAALVSDDGIVFKMFSRENWRSFVEMIVLQMIDVIYARVQPASWGLDSITFPGVIEELVPLRDAASRLVHLVELVSHCILERFQCQSWRQLGSSSNAFVSSVDPQEYKSLLLTGGVTSSVPSPGSVRFQCFKKAIPRREIETLWLLLAFFADGSTDNACGSKYRWRLIASLVGNRAGVLSKDYLDSITKDESNLPPNEDHLSRCREEMARFCGLLSSAALNPLPDSDSFLTKIVQKCLLLQAHEYRYSSDECRQEMVFVLDADDRSAIAKSWKPTDLLSLNGATEQQDSPIRTTGEATTFLSVSPLVQSCVALMGAWVDLVPEKKARRSRLAQSLNTLVADCINSASKLETSNNQNNRVDSGSTFEQAFAIPVTNIGSQYAATAYREAASRFFMMGAVGGPDGTTQLLTKQLRERVWDIMCDSEMKQRQQSIVSPEGTSSSRTYSGNLFRLFCSARIMACLLNLHLLSVGAFGEEIVTGSPPGSSTTELDDDKSMLVFLASSLVACLDCACDLIVPQTNIIVGRDQEAASHFENVSCVVSRICLWLNQLCVRSRVALREHTATAETPLLRLRSAAEELRANLFGMVASPMKKCLLLLTSSSFHGENADLALLSVLGLIRAVAGLTVTRVEGRSTDSPGTKYPSSSRHVERPPEDDLFGSMDDDLFMNIDLDIAGRGQADSNRPNNALDKDVEGFKGIWVVLVDMIKLTKPSERFAILPPTGTSTAAKPCMSIPGRTVAANNIGEICACLAALTCLDKQDSLIIDSSLDTFASSMKVQGWAARDDVDQGYFRSVAQCFYSELCSLSADYERCNQLVQKRWDIVTEHFVGAMLDSNTLERFPSMNLRRIKENGGARSERKQSLRLKLANSARQSDDPTRESINEAGARLGRGEKENSPGPSYNSSHLWSFCKSLGKAAARRDGVSGGIIREFRLDSVFLDLDSDLASRPRDSIQLVSLEKECLKRMMFFRGILGNSARCRSMTGTLNFEALSNLIIACCCHELASISKGVHYQARFGRKNADDGAKTYKHARLLELQSCYTELTIGLLAWILRECPSTKSASFESTLQCVRDQLFSQILSKRTTIDMHQTLQSLYSVATPGAIGVNTVTRPLAATETDESGVLNDVSLAVVRRSREIILHIALEQRENGLRNVYCLLNAFVTLGIHCKANSLGDGEERHFLDLFASSMYDDIRNTSAVSRPGTNVSPLQRALDEYMRHVALVRDGRHQESTDALQHLSHVMLRQFLVPKLFKDDVVLSQKKGILFLLSTILQVELKRSAQEEGLEVHFIASIAQGLASCVRSSLESPVVDDELVCIAFQCTKYSLTFPVLESDDSSASDDTVLSWSRRYQNSDASSNKPPHALYLWTFATWMNCVGKMIVGRTDADEKRLHEFRSTAVSLVMQGKSIWNDQESEDELVQESSRLVSLESRVFVEKENTRPVTNVYAKAKPKQQQSTDSIEKKEWKPSSSVCRAAKELEAKFIAVL